MYKAENGGTNLVGYYDGSILFLEIDLKEKMIPIKAIPYLSLTMQKYQ